jgi:DNA-binding SARP family transcriptional activator/Flp pilus assembly protein TadD
MAKLNIRLFGGFRLEQEAGSRIPLSGRKGMLLLSRLAVPLGMTHSREQLQDLLWPDADQKHAQGNLRYLLHRLRKIIPSECRQFLVCEGSQVSLDANHVAVDIEQFERLVFEGTPPTLAEACVLYNGDLLAGLPVSDPRFEEWLGPERERLRELAREAFWRRFQFDILQSDITAAKNLANRYLAIDPYAERMYHALIRLYFVLGERALAARLYKRLKETLAQDLQIQPDPDIGELVRLAVDDPAHAPVPARFDPAWVLGQDENKVIGDREESLPITEKPSIAVLPFLTVRGGREQDQIAEGITEDIVTGLSRFHSFVVTARNTSEFAKESITGIKLVAGDSPAGYLLQGSTRMMNNRSRISVRLIDAGTGEHIWAEQYDRQSAEFDEVQDQFTQSIISAIAPQIFSAEIVRAKSLLSENLSAHDLALHALDRASYARTNSSKAANQEAIALAERAVAMNGRCALGYAAIARCHFWNVVLSWTTNEDRSLASAEEAANNMKSLNSGDHQAYYYLGRVAFARRQYDLALSTFHRAIDLNPNDLDLLGYMAWVEGSSGLPQAAREHAEHALTLNPQDPETRQMIYWNLAQAAFITGDYHQGSRYAQQACGELPDHAGGYGMLAACLAESGNFEDARGSIGKAMRLAPSYVRDRILGNSYFRNEADHNRFVGALRNAASDLRI